VIRVPKRGRILTSRPRNVDVAHW